MTHRWRIFYVHVHCCILVRLLLVVVHDEIVPAFLDMAFIQLASLLLPLRQTDVAD
jgi:hypothetical protein